MLVFETAPTIGQQLSTMIKKQRTPLARVSQLPAAGVWNVRAVVAIATGPLRDRLTS